MTKAVAVAAAATKTNKLIAGIKNRGGGICRPPVRVSKKWLVATFSSFYGFCLSH